MQCTDQYYSWKIHIKSAQWATIQHDDPMNLHRGNLQLFTIASCWFRQSIGSQSDFSCDESIFVYAMFWISIELMTALSAIKRSAPRYGWLIASNNCCVCDELIELVSMSPTTTDVFALCRLIGGSAAITDADDPNAQNVRLVAPTLSEDMFCTCCGFAPGFKWVNCLDNIRYQYQIVKLIPGSLRHPSGVRCSMERFLENWLINPQNVQGCCTLNWISINQAEVIRWLLSVRLSCLQNTLRAARMLLPSSGYVIELVWDMSSARFEYLLSSFYLRWLWISRHEYSGCSWR